MQERRSFLSVLPPVTTHLIIINILVWLAQQVLPKVGIDLTNILGMHYFQAESFRFWQLLSYAFLHSTESFSHLFFNMFALFMFGSAIEHRFGSQRYILYYLVCALVAALSQQAVWAFSLYSIAASAIPYISLPSGTLVATASFLNQFITVGASGALFGILLAFGWFFPNSRIFFFFIPYPIKAKYFVIIYGIIELVFGISSSGDGVAHFAHLGGMLGGLILILIWKYWRPSSRFQKGRWSFRQNGEDTGEL